MMTTVEARALLPTFQTAMLYAVADSDRAERVVDDPVLGMERGGLLPPRPRPARLVGQRNRRLVGRAILDANPLTTGTWRKICAPQSSDMPARLHPYRVGSSGSSSRLRRSRASRSRSRATTSRGDPSRRSPA